MTHSNQRSKGIANIRPSGEYTWNNLWLFYQRCYTSRRLRYIHPLGGYMWSNRRLLYALEPWLSGAEGATTLASSMRVNPL